MNTERTYRRLPGRSGVFIRHSLWMGPDHLLRVRTHPFSQEYRRYYFKDIQALVLTERTKPAVYFLYLSAGLFGLFSILLFTSGHPVWGTLSAVSGVFLLWFGWRIPDCDCRVQTRVSSDRLPSLGKLHDARRTLPLIKAAVDQVQGEFNRELPLPQVLVPVSAPATGSGLAPHEEAASGKIVAHWILFVLLLLHATYLLAGVGFKLQSVTYTLTADAFAAAAFVTAVVTALQQRHMNIERRVRLMVYACLGWQVLSFAAGIGVGGYIGFQLAVKRAVAADFLSASRLFQFVNAVAYLLLAVGGMTLLWLHHRVQTAPPQIEQDPIPVTSEQQ